MRILLLKPCWDYPIDPGDSTYNRTWPPLSLLNCAALLRNNGFDVSVLDASAKRIGPEEVAGQAKGYDKIFITSASLDRWQCPNLNLKPFTKIVFRLKQVCDAIYLMGTHGTVRPKEIMNLTDVTALVRGEPEGTVLDICQGMPLESIPGLTLVRDGKMIDTGDRSPFDLSQMPIPAYDLVDIEDYNYEVLGARFALLEASRGCPFSCMFCVKTMYGDGFRKKTAEQFIREVNYIIDEVKAKTAYFIDLEFTINRDLVETVCHHLIQRNTPLAWCCQTRADSVDEPMLKLMKRAGCKIVHFGVETGSDRIRKRLHKGITFAQVEKGLRAARNAGLQTVCFFLFGLPTETVDEMKETIRFAKKLNPTFASFHIALPYPGTAFHHEIEGELGGALFPNAYTGVVSYGTLENIAKKAFRSYYLRPRYIAGRLKDGNFGMFFTQVKFFLSYLKHRLWS